MSVSNRVKSAFVKGVIVGILAGIAAETTGIYVSDLATRVSRIEFFLSAITQGR